MPNSATNAVAKAADNIAGNENREIETATSIIMIGVGIGSNFLPNTGDQIMNIISNVGTAGSVGTLLPVDYFWQLLQEQNDNEEQDEDDQ